MLKLSAPEGIPDFYIIKYFIAKRLHFIHSFIDIPFVVKFLILHYYNV